MDSRFRAKESDRPDALCRDRFARIFADTSPLPRGVAPWSVVARTQPMTIASPRPSCQGSQWPVWSESPYAPYEPINSKEIGATSTRGRKRHANP
jgi:hypothetical protein